MTHTKTFTNRYETSQDYELTGAESDLFIGESYNIAVGLTNNITLIEEIWKDAVPNTGEVNKGFVIGKRKGFIVAPKGEATQFIYSQDHIINYLIPNLTELRNDLLINDADYKAIITDINDVRFAANNDSYILAGDRKENNPFYTDSEDYIGASYEYLPAHLDFDDRPNDFKDKIRWYNQQIRLWEEALARNEKEKINSKLIKNISFDAGSVTAYTQSVSIDQSETVNIEVSLDITAALKVGGKVAGSGLEVEHTLGFEANIGHSWGSGSVETNTYGYELHDPDQGDYFSVDVRDPGTGTSPCFAIKAGRSMCPREGRTEALYFKELHYKLTTENLDYISDDLDDQIPATMADDFLKTFDILKALASGNVADIFDNASLNDHIIDAISEIKDEVYKSEIKFDKAIRETEGFKAIFDLQTIVAALDPAALVEDFEMAIEEIKTHGLAEPEVNRSFTDKVLDIIKRQAGYEPFPSNPKPIYLDVGTIGREVPIITAVPALQTEIYEDKKAFFTLSLKNGNPFGETMWYELRVEDDSNSKGAIVHINGAPIDESVYEVPTGDPTNLVLTIEKGQPDVFEYDSIGIVIYSSCDWASYTNGRPMELADTVKLAVHYIPACSDIEVLKPFNQYIMNYDMKNEDNEYFMNVSLNKYALDSENLKKFQLQYKPVTSSNWIGLQTWWKNEDDKENEIEDVIDGSITSYS